MGFYFIINDMGILTMIAVSLGINKLLHSDNPGITLFRMLFLGIFVVSLLLWIVVGITLLPPLYYWVGSVLICTLLIIVAIVI